MLVDSDLEEDSGGNNDNGWIGLLIGLSKISIFTGLGVGLREVSVSPIETGVLHLCPHGGYSSSSSL